MLVKVIKPGIAGADQDFVDPVLHLLALGTHLMKDHCILILGHDQLLDLLPLHDLKIVGVNCPDLRFGGLMQYGRSSSIRYRVFPLTLPILSL